MNLLDWINQGIDGMTQVAGPGMDSLGFRIFIALLTTMMVWFGVQEALSSSQGGAGFNFAKFVHFVVLASFAYTLIEFYDNTIPGDRKSTRLNSSHRCISYAVFCLKKKKNIKK